MAYRRKDPSRRNVITLAKASGTAIAEGNLVKKNGTSNNVTAWTPGAAIVGIALETAASASTAAIKVDMLDQAVWLVADVTSGTPASGDFRSCDGDLNGLTVATDTNHDFLYTYNGTTTTGDVLPHKLEVNTAA